MEFREWTVLEGLTLQLHLLRHRLKFSFLKRMSRYILNENHFSTWKLGLQPVACASCSYASWVCKSNNVPLPNPCGNPIVKIILVELHRVAHFIIQTKNKVFSYEKFDDFGSQNCLPSTIVYHKGRHLYSLLIAYVELIYNRFLGSFHAQRICSWFSVFNINNATFNCL